MGDGVGRRTWGLLVGKRRAGAQCARPCAMTRPDKAERRASNSTYDGTAALSGGGAAIRYAGHVVANEPANDSAAYGKGDPLIATPMIRGCLRRWRGCSDPERLVRRAGYRLKSTRRDGAPGLNGRLSECLRERRGGDGVEQCERGKVKTATMHSRLSEVGFVAGSDAGSRITLIRWSSYDGFLCCKRNRNTAKACSVCPAIYTVQKP